MNKDIPNQQCVMTKLASEYSQYMDGIAAFPKSKLFDKALWIHAVQMVFEHISAHRLTSDDLHFLAMLPNPLNAIAREYMKTYGPDALAMSIGDGIIAAGNAIKSANPKLYANLKYVNVGEADKIRLIKRIDHEFGIYKDVNVTLLDKEEIIARAEAIALRTAVYKAMREYPYHEDEIRVLIQAKHPLETVVTAVEKTALDDMGKWDLFEASFDNVCRMSEARKKSHRRDAR